MNEAKITAARREVMVLGALTVLAAGRLGSGAIAKETSRVAAARGRDVPFNEGWRFQRGGGENFETAAYDDGGWRQIVLPHDWSIEDVPEGQAPQQLGPFDKGAVGGTSTGFTVGGEGWYRKHFRLDALPEGARVEIEFDAVYGLSEVWLNGMQLGEHIHGYAPFAYDLTRHLVREGENVLAVRVANIGKNSRWYAGSGIYRQVCLNITPSGTRVARWGVGAWTRRIAAGAAEVDVTTTLDDPSPAAVLMTRLRDAQGRVVAEAKSSASASVKQALVVRGARLWSPVDPYLHTLESEVVVAGKTTDRVVEAFGIRIIAMDSTRGLTVNGERHVLRGGNIHHDNGLLGACAFPQADDRRIRLLKERGYNAIRSAHNPMSRSLLAACDRHGMLVMNEAFDMWHVAKNPDDYAKSFALDWRNVIEAMVLSSRNHPCVIMWSIGNEIPDRSSREGIKWEWTLANAVRTLDPTRPVTAALNGLLGPLVEVGAQTARPGHAGQQDNASSVFLDVAGYNYRLNSFEADHAEVPSRIMLGTETYPNEAWAYVRLCERAPYVLGEFVWTAMDYIGEVAIGSVTYTGKDAGLSDPAAWPWVVSWCGDIDLIGHQKIPSLYRDVAWGVSKLEIAVHRPVPEGKTERISKWGWPDLVQRWNWSGDEGKQKDVHIYTSGDRVEVLLNGRKVGDIVLRAEDKLKGIVPVPYSAGVLEVVSYSDGKPIARRRLETVGAPARLRIRPETAGSGAVGMGKGLLDLGYLPIDVVDADGRVVPDAQVEITLAISEGADLAGFGSANPLATGSFQMPRGRSFGGRALAILRGKGVAASVKVTASSPGLEGAGIVLNLA